MKLAAAVSSIQFYKPDHFLCLAGNQVCNTALTAVVLVAVVGASAPVAAAWEWRSRAAQMPVACILHPSHKQYIPDTAGSSTTCQDYLQLSLACDHDGWSMEGGRTTQPQTNTRECSCKMRCLYAWQVTFFRLRQAAQPWMQPSSPLMSLMPLGYGLLLATFSDSSMRVVRRRVGGNTCSPAAWHIGTPAPAAAAAAVVLRPSGSYSKLSQHACASHQP